MLPEFHALASIWMQKACAFSFIRFTEYIKRRQFMATIEQQIKSATDKLAKLKARELLARQRQLAKDKAAERRADAHRKIELGGLVIAADAADLNPAELVGALLTYLNSRNDERAEALRKRGLDHLEAREAARKARR
ncbi:conjugal transfer protein TraD [Xanthomonas codiaei]|nr:conjugal transfer protein TraD [Xanthomonas codiaei]